MAVSIVDALKAIDAVRTIPKSQVNYANQTKRVCLKTKVVKAPDQTAAVLIAAILVRLTVVFLEIQVPSVFLATTVPVQMVLYVSRVVYPGSACRLNAVYGVQRNRLKKS